jgi:hypothetical protein
MESMGKLAERIRLLIQNERYAIGVHASERLEERGILEWQVIESVEMGRVVEERPKAKPNPTVEIVGALPDGVEIKSVWAHLRRVDVAKLVTVHYLD